MTTTNVLRMVGRVSTGPIGWGVFTAVAIADAFKVLKCTSVLSEKYV